jgi:predicted ribosomally synthesized peptide with SipW-like signal peptide
MKKIGLLVLAVVLALGLVGVGYAAWSQNVNATVTVNAGTLAASGYSTSGTAFDSYGMKDATYAVANAGYDTVTVTLSNAYPGTFTVPFYLVNDGTVPVGSVSIANVNDAGGYGAVLYTAITNSGPWDVGAYISGTFTIVVPSTYMTPGGTNTYTFNAPITLGQ